MSDKSLRLSFSEMFYMRSYLRVRIEELEKESKYIEMPEITEPIQKKIDCFKSHYQKLEGTIFKKNIFPEAKENICIIKEELTERKEVLEYRKRIFSGQAQESIILEKSNLEHIIIKYA